MGPTFSLALTLALTVLLITFFINRQFYLAADEDEGAILVLGDSWASLSGSFLADVCSLGLEGSGSTSSGKPLTNNGKSGPTAQQWVPGEKAVNSFEKAKYDRDYDDSVSEEMTSIATWEHTMPLPIIALCDIRHLRIVESSSNDDIQVLYTGYGYPSENICGGGNDVDVTPIFDHMSTTILEKIEKSEYANKVLTMDILSLYVTKDSEPYSDKTWYADDIHINEAGYIKLFSNSEIQQFFGCSIITDIEDDKNGSAAPPSSGHSKSSKMFSRMVVQVLLFLLIPIVLYK
eukprot:CAMPEP_0203634488 /NCGR_PEP_ID=MMETSP0088-20131115/1417_1 /ASSEMBLY_ACC=CAM_ASM_001087 /TAXON_ID=426623 /ORGANISM="Chaetoceros affinis, Strain CCMP159" /LENGTH=289 /DNA_ID=CAMNT_0050488101 /DNA_START=226 /DNA_END=1097 /DNA_ORIENTATION=-